MTDSELKAKLEEYVAAQPPAANPGAVNWVVLLPILQMLIPLVVPPEVLAKIREWINRIFPTA